MRSSLLSLSALFALSACAPSRSSTPRAPVAPVAPVATTSSAADASSNDPAAAIARVEHGLIPEVRVAGDTRGWTIEERLRAHHTPAVSVAVIHNYRVAWAKAYGVKDLASGARPDTETLFQAASISKMVTALAALEQVDAGRVTLEANINQGLRSWKLPENELTRGNPVTLERLLAHTAGVSVRSMVGYPEGAPLPTLHQILDGKPPANTPPVRVEHEPGKEFHYSGGGATIVQQLVVDVAERPFPAAMRELVFAPFGLTHSTFELPLPEAQRALTATEYDIDESVFPPTVNPEAAAAGLWSTPTDLAQFLVEVQLGLLGRSKVVSKALAGRMTTGIAPIGVPGVFTGMGTFVEHHGDSVYFGHDGMNDGFLAVSRAGAKNGEGAVVMTNGAGGGPLLFEIIRSIAAEYKWDGWLPPPIVPAKLSAARLKALAGRYASSADQSLTIVVDGDRLSAREPFAEPLELIPISDDTFVSRLDNARFQFRRGAGGRDELIDTPHDDDPLTLLRVADDRVEPLRLLEANRDDEALALYRQLLAANPKEPTLGERRFDAIASELLDRRFDLERAIRVFKIETALYPESASANAGLALAYLRAGKREAAQPFLNRTLALLGRDKKLSEVEQIYLGIRVERMKRLAGK